MAQRTAEELRDLEQQTLQAADNVSDSSDSREEDAGPRIDEVEEQQQQVNERIEDLIDALVEDANAQDLLTEEGRERARDADDSVAMVQREFPQADLICNDVNCGYACANNLGLRKAQGQYLLLLNPDTVLPASALQEMLTFMEQHPDAGVVRFPPANSC